MREVFLVIVALSAQPAVSATVATPMSAMHLHSACRDAQTDEYARGFCDGAIDALYGLMENWCVPSDVTHREVKEHVKDELLRSAPAVGLGAFELVSRAVHRRWPCAPDETAT